MSEKLRGRIIRSAKRNLDCQVLATGELVKGTALRMLIKGKGHHIVVGDYVELEEGKIPGEYVITSIEDRINTINCGDMN